MRGDECRKCQQRQRARRRHPPGRSCRRERRVATRSRREAGRTGGASRGDGSSPPQSHKPDSSLSLLISGASGGGGLEASMDPLLVGADHGREAVNIGGAAAIKSRVVNLMQENCGQPVHRNVKITRRVGRGFMSPMPSISAPPAAGERRSRMSRRPGRARPIAPFRRWRGRRRAVRNGMLSSGRARERNALLQMGRSTTKRATDCSRLCSLRVATDPALSRVNLSANSRLPHAGRLAGRALSPNSSAP